MFNDASIWWYYDHGYDDDDCDEDDCTLLLLKGSGIGWNRMKLLNNTIITII